MATFKREALQDLTITLKNGSIIKVRPAGVQGAARGFGADVLINIEKLLNK